MSVPAYSEYRDSGVPWLGRVPLHWNVHQTKRHFIRKKETNAGMICENRLALTMNGVLRRSLDDLDGLQSSDYEGYQLFEEGDLAFKLIDLQNIKTSRVGLVPERGIMSPAYIRLQPLGSTDVRFAYWYFMALYWTQVFNVLGGGVRQTLGPEELLTVEYPLPSLEEQTAIATFLDRETAKIDALIAEQEKLLTLLAEKRQATISHAVTKGLNPDAPMKDSGVEWLGEVPAHWDIFPLRRALASTDYGVSESLNSNGKIAVLRMGNIAGGKVILSDLKYLESVDESLILEPGDLLFNRTNSLDLIAKVGLFEGALGIDVSFASYLVRLRLKPGFSSLFFSYLLNISAILGEARASAFVAIGQCNLNPNRYGQIVVPIPPADEQATIATFLETEIKRLGALTAEVTSAIDLLKERRTALISAAVTGKIDVRHLADQEAA